jgi:A/G-specific adenine glycosylase
MLLAAQMPVHLFDSVQVSVLRRRLLGWFDRHRRDLPWRRDRDPYRIWVSEVMLQQTTVATVRPRFEQFLAAFPTVQALADADEQVVLRQWQGLGYYRRARDLHRAARLLAADHMGRLPDDPEIWRQLPGVGRYILGAVLSQAFGSRLPIVEANSQRVLCRLFGQQGDPTAGPVKAWLWQTAETLLPRQRVGDFNQALMELGAIVCTPAAPRCGGCPLESHCVARRKGLQESIPARPAPPKIEEVPEVALVVRDGPKALLVQRPAAGRWASMWEFPHLALNKKESHRQAARRLLKTGLGIKADVGGELLTIRHAVTRFRITMVCLEAVYRSGSSAKSAYQEARWLEPDELHAYPVSTPQRKLAEAISSAYQDDGLLAATRSLRSGARLDSTTPRSAPKTPRRG